MARIRFTTLSYNSRGKEVQHALLAFAVRYRGCENLPGFSLVLSKIWKLARDELGSNASVDELCEMIKYFDADRDLSLKAVQLLRRRYRHLKKLQLCFTSDEVECAGPAIYSFVEKAKNIVDPRIHSALISLLEIQFPRNSSSPGRLIVEELCRVNLSLPYQRINLARVLELLTTRNRDSAHEILNAQISQNGNGEVVDFIINYGIRELSTCENIGDIADYNKWRKQVDASAAALEFIRWSWEAKQGQQSHEGSRRLQGRSREVYASQADLSSSQGAS